MIHALVLSGGGAKGSWEAGAAAAILEYYRHTNSPVTILSGTSVGALNAAAIASNGPEWTMDLWRRIEERDVFRKRRLLIPFRIKRSGALYDSSPLLKLIYQHLNVMAVRRSPYEVFVHATVPDTQQQVVFDKRDDDFLNGVFASASIPAVFPAVAWRGRWLVDGGTVDNSPVRTAIKAGAQKVTVVYLDHRLPQPRIEARSAMWRVPPIERAGLLESGMLALDSMMDAHFRRDVKMVELINAAVAAGLDTNGYRKVDLQVVAPKGPVGGTLDFNRSLMRRNVKAGYDQTVRFLSRPRR